MNEQESDELNLESETTEAIPNEIAEKLIAEIDDAPNIIAEADAESQIEDDEFDFEELDDDDDDKPSRYRYMQNRELSWLTFNERVLDQGADESVPLLERLNFISIFWSNLQEFFMVRVGSLTDLSFIEPPVHDSKTGMTCKEQIRAIHDRCSELYPIQESYYEHVRGSLAKEGVRHLRPEDISDEQRNYLIGLIKHNIEPFLSPQIINSRHPFPHLENGKLYILVRLDDEAYDSDGKRKKKGKKKEKEKGKGAAEGVLFGLIPLPHQCERVIKLPGRGFQFILLEHAIEMFVPEIFSMYKIKHTNVICVTRNADIDANQGFDEQDEDYREHMKRLLKKRARLAPVRLECERPLSSVMEKLMLNKLGLKRFQVYDTIVPLDLSFTWGLGSRLSDKKREKLSSTPFAPAWPTSFDKNKRIMDQVEDRETLLFYPFESMDPFVQLLREASTDPDVVSIKITLYRLASQSHLAEALIAAADNGKEVTALFELRARFDESNNIIWSQRFEEAGCNVIYGFRDYKVHSKICCITRRKPDGSIQHITQLGTGNYNEKTAKLYTDLSFITTSEEFGRDAVEFFRNMQLENVSDNYQVLRVAPLQIKPLILENLDKQIENARAGKPAKAFMKANSVTDKDVMEKIAEASNAGVDITLFIRGICCIVPRIKGATENVRVVSIVGRLLEHSRIYCFGEGDDTVVYLSSADLMTRNLNKRVEIAWPVLDRELRDRVLTYIDICMSDTAKLRELRANATYTPLGAFCDIDDEGNATPAFDAQNTLIDQAAEAAIAMAELDAAAEAEAAAAAEAAEAAGEAESLEAEAPASETLVVEEPVSGIDEMASEPEPEEQPEAESTIESPDVREEPEVPEASELEDAVPEVLEAEESADAVATDSAEAVSEALESEQEVSDAPELAEVAEAAVAALEVPEATAEAPEASEADIATAVGLDAIESVSSPGETREDVIEDSEAQEQAVTSSIEPEPIESAPEDAGSESVPDEDSMPADTVSEPEQQVSPETDEQGEAIEPEGMPAESEQPNEGEEPEAIEGAEDLEPSDVAETDSIASGDDNIEAVTADEQEAAPEAESEAADVSEPEELGVEAPATEAEPAGVSEPEPSDEQVAATEAGAEPDVEEPKAPEAQEEAPEVETEVASALETETPVASERVAELIDQLGSNSEQRIGSTAEPLTEMRIYEIIPSLDSGTEKSEESQSAQQEAESAPAASIVSEATEATDVAQPEAASVQADQAESGEDAMPASSSEGEPGATEQSETKIGGEKVDTEAADEFFSQKSREIDMPEKKKKGFFARFFGW